MDIDLSKLPDETKVTEKKGTVVCAFIFRPSTDILLLCDFVCNRRTDRTMKIPFTYGLLTFVFAPEMHPYLAKIAVSSRDLGLVGSTTPRLGSMDILKVSLDHFVKYLLFSGLWELWSTWAYHLWGQTIPCLSLVLHVPKRSQLGHKCSQLFRLRCSVFF